MTAPLHNIAHHCIAKGSPKLHGWEEVSAMGQWWVRKGGYEVEYFNLFYVNFDLQLIQLTTCLLEANPVVT